MARDEKWPERCTLMGCTAPARRPHHHHMAGGYLAVAVCQCENVAEPGTRPVVDDYATARRYLTDVARDLPGVDRDRMLARFDEWAAAERARARQ